MDESLPVEIRIETRNTAYTRDIIDLLDLVDTHATGVHYETSTADVARSLFFTDEARVTDRTALKVFYESLTDHAVLAFLAGDLIGITLVRNNDATFEDLLPQHTPHIAIQFTAVHPDHQRRGVWTRLRDEVETTLAPQYGAEYLVTAVPEENTASQTANESADLTHVSTHDSDFEDTDTLLYAKGI